MIGNSNADRDKAVEFLRAYASYLQEHGMRTTKLINARRMALNLANKMERKQPLPVESETKRKPQSKKCLFQNHNGCR